MRLFLLVGMFWKLGQFLSESCVLQDTKRMGLGCAANRTNEILLLLSFHLKQTLTMPLCSRRTRVICTQGFDPIMMTLAGIYCISTAISCSAWIDRGHHKPEYAYEIGKDYESRHSSLRPQRCARALVQNPLFVSSVVKLPITTSMTITTMKETKENQRLRDAP